MAEGCCQRGRLALAASAGWSHVPPAREDQLGVPRDPKPAGRPPGGSGLAPDLVCRGPAHLRKAGAWAADNPWLGCRHSDGTLAATTANNANAADPVEAPALPQASGRRWGCCMLWGAQNFRRYVCVCVCLHVFNFLDALFKTVGLMFKISLGASKFKN